MSKHIGNRYSLTNSKQILNKYLIDNLNDSIHLIASKLFELVNFIRKKNYPNLNIT